MTNRKAFLDETKFKHCRRDEGMGGLFQNFILFSHLLDRSIACLHPMIVDLAEQQPLASGLGRGSVEAGG